MSEKALNEGLVLRVNGGKLELDVLQKKQKKENQMEERFNTIIEEHGQVKYLAFYIILAFCVAYVVLAYVAPNVLNGLIGLAIIAILGYLGVSYINFLGMKFIMDTIRKMVGKSAANEKEKNDVDHKINEKLNFDKD